jgi:hypothetical protein
MGPDVRWNGDIPATVTHHRLIDLPTATLVRLHHAGERTVAPGGDQAERKPTGGSVAQDTGSAFGGHRPESWTSTAPPTTA